MRAHVEALGLPVALSLLPWPMLPSVLAVDLLTWLDPLLLEVCYPKRVYPEALPDLALVHHAQG